MTTNRKSGERRARRGRRHARVLKRVRGTAQRPRLVVFRSLRHLEGQLIDDDRGATLVGVSTRSPRLGEVEVELGDRTGKVAESYQAGALMARLALEAGVEKVVFDRAGYLYHGRVQAFADGARAGGLRF